MSTNIINMTCTNIRLRYRIPYNNFRNRKIKFVTFALYINYVFGIEMHQTSSELARVLYCLIILIQDNLKSINHELRKDFLLRIRLHRCLDDGSWSSEPQMEDFQENCKYLFFIFSNFAVPAIFVVL